MAVRAYPQFTRSSIGFQIPAEIDSLCDVVVADFAVPVCNYAY